MQALAGAKNHMVVMPDADMEQATDALMTAAYGSAGERCMAISVAVTVGQAGDEIIERMVPRLAALRVGPGTDPESEMGPLITADHLAKVSSYVDVGIEEGAELIADGRGVKLQGYENGFFLGACLFDQIKTDMRIYQEEIFGPVLCVVRADSFEEGLRLTNDHTFGNGAAIFTRDGDTAREFSSRVQAGMVGINVPIPVPASLPQLRRLEAVAVRRPPHPRARGRTLLYAAEDDDRALAVQRAHAVDVRHADHGLIDTRRDQQRAKSCHDGARP